MARLRSQSLRFIIAPLLFSILLITGCGSGNSGSAGGGTPPAPPPSGGPGTPPPATDAYIYVGSMDVGSQNQLAAVSVTSDAVAHTVPGSPYTGPGGSPVATSDSVFATDGTNIQTYTRNPDGSLVAASIIDGTAHNDTPKDSGVGSLTLDRSGHTLYAGELNFEGTSNAAYAAFNVGQAGKLSFLSNSQINVDYHVPLAFTKNNSDAYGFGCYFINWDVFGVARTNSGSLVPLPNGGDPPPQSDNSILCPVAVATSAQNYLAVAFSDITTSNPQMLAMYHISNDGSLTLVQNSVVSTGLAGINALSFDPTGNSLTAAGTGGLQLFQVAPGGLLTALGAPQQTTAIFTDLGWDNANHLYGLAGVTLYIFNFTSGTLTLATGSPFDVGASGTMAVVPTT